MSTNDSILEQILYMQQRGGRMLSIIDLIRAGTVPKELAAYLINGIINGKSISSGSLIGGTGKTTLLASLLAFIPNNRYFITVTYSNLRDLLKNQDPGKKVVYLCHEISPANYYSYLWGKDINLYLSLKKTINQQLAFTIHADTYDELFKQIVNSETGLTENDFLKIDLLVFIKAVETSGYPERKVTYVYETDESSKKHKLIYDYLQAEPFYNKYHVLKSKKSKDSHTMKEIESFLSTCIEKNIYRIEDVRKSFLSLGLDISD